MRTAHRRIRTKLAAGERVFGTTVQLPSPEIVEIAGYSGVDFAWIDAEHGTMDLGDINQLVRAADAVGIDAVVRVPDHSPSFIQRVLDIGAAGILAPHVRTLEEAAAIAAATKYAPDGTRGACPTTRSAGHNSRDWPVQYRQANQDVLAFGLIEDEEGVENVEAISARSGLDGLMFGPFDLAQAAGLEGDVSHPTIEKQRSRVTAATAASGIEYLTIVGWDPGDLSAVAEYSRIFIVFGDRPLLADGLSKALTETRRAIGQVPGAGQ
jgi:2-keto-3-deoxy-L-rhamnonate aldolase RhmA